MAKIIIILILAIIWCAGGYIGSLAVVSGCFPGIRTKTEKYVMVMLAAIFSWAFIVYGMAVCKKGVDDVVEDILINNEKQGDYE